MEQMSESMAESKCHLHYRRNASLQWHKIYAGSCFPEYIRGLPSSKLNTNIPHNNIPVHYHVHFRGETLHTLCC